jgi:predicted nucleotidyltransferase
LIIEQRLDEGCPMATKPLINSLRTEQIAEYCRRWKITELALFGSALRDDFGPESDIDLLVTFEPDAPWSLLDIVHMQYELADMLDRPVDLVERRAIERSENWIRRRQILGTAQTFYVSG